MAQRRTSGRLKAAVAGGPSGEGRATSSGKKAEGKSWQHRIGSGPGDALADAFVASLDFDTRLLPFDVAGSKAHAAMLADCGLISAADLSAIREGLDGILADFVAGRLAVDVRHEDIHMLVEAELIGRVGEPGRRLHTGRSRNDQVALDLCLWTQWAAGEAAAAANALRLALSEAAEANVEVIVPAYTHLQQAQPVSAAAGLLAHAAALGRDVRRLGLAGEMAGVMPLGSGAVAGTTLGIDRRRTLAHLRSAGYRFSSLSSNSVDATASRDLLSTLGFALAQTMVSLSRLAEDLIIQMSQEFGYVQIADAYTTGSSMMPQKRNPDVLELVRGKAGLVVGQLTGLLVMQKGLPLAYNRDMQEDKRMIFAAYDHTLASLRVMEPLVRSIRYNAEAVEACIDRGYMDATALSEYLVTIGVAFRTSHQIVGGLVRRCIESERRGLATLSVEEVRSAVLEAGGGREAADRVSSKMAGWLGPANVARAYCSEGHGGPSSCLRQIRALRRELARKGKQA